MASAPGSHCLLPLDRQTVQPTEHSRQHPNAYHSQSAGSHRHHGKYLLGAEAHGMHKRTTHTHTHTQIYPCLLGHLLWLEVQNK